MTLFVVLVLAAAGVGAAWIVRDRPQVGHLVGLLALVIVTLAVAAVPPGDAVEITGITLVATPYARLLLALLALSGLALAAIAAVSGEDRSPAVAWLAVIAAGVVALTTESPSPGTWMILAAAAVGLALPVAAITGRDRITISMSALTTSVIGAALAVGSMAVGTAQLRLSEPDAGIVGLTVIGVAAAVAIRGAVIPFHRWAPPVADVSSGPIVAALVGALPMLAAILALVWLDQEVTPLLLPLEVTQAIVLATALAAMLLSAVAAWIQDDLGHATAYLLGHATALTLVGLAALDPDAWAPTRSWAIVAIAAAAALTGWLTVMEGRYRTRRLPDLRGWVRRSPLLAFALGLTFVATIGLPGMVVFDARLALVDLAGNPITSLVGTVAVFAPLLAVVRILVVGLDVPSAAVRGAAEERPHRPAGRLGPGFTRALVRANRAPLASILALGLALGAVLMATGVFELATAAGGDPPVAPIDSGDPGDSAAP